MSKTKKIKRLERQVKALNNKINVLEFSNQNLLREAHYVIPSRHYTPRPEFRSDSYTEECWYNNILDYIYSAMDKEYRKVYDTEPMKNRGNIKFIVYMSHDLIGKLMNVSGYRDFGTTSNGGITFRGWEVVEVRGHEYIHFVRKYD